MSDMLCTRAGRDARTHGRTKGEASVTLSRRCGNHRDRRGQAAGAPPADRLNSRHSLVGTARADARGRERGRTLAVGGATRHVLARPRRGAHVAPAKCLWNRAAAEMKSFAWSWLLLAGVLATAEPLPPAPRVRWGQTNEKLFITFLLRPVPAAENLRVTFNCSHVHLTGVGTALDALLPLREDVVPEACTWSTTRDGVKATLLKQAPHRFDQLVRQFWVLSVGPNGIAVSAGAC